MISHASYCTAPGGRQRESDIVEGIIGYWTRCWGWQSWSHLRNESVKSFPTFNIPLLHTLTIPSFFTLQVINPVKGVWHLGLVKDETTLLGSSLPSLHITPELDLRLVCRREKDKAVQLLRSLNLYMPGESHFPTRR